MCHFLFLTFFGTISGVRDSTPGPSEAEKLIGSGKKKSQLPPEGRFLELIQKKVSGTGDVSQGLCLWK